MAAVATLCDISPGDGTHFVKNFKDHLEERHDLLSGLVADGNKFQKQSTSQDFCD